MSTSPRILTRNIPGESSGWLAGSTEPAQSGHRLFCFPHAGGSAHVFRGWQSAMPGDFEVCPVHLPGRGSRIHEPPLTELHELVARAARALAPYSQGPVVLLGHSMGGLIAFELARVMRDQYGIEPAALFVLGKRAPQLPSRETATFDLPEPEFVRAVRELNGTPEGLLDDPDARSFVLPLLRADFALVQNYCYTEGPPLRCPMVVYGGLMDSGATHDELAAWRVHTTGPFRTSMFAGDHFFPIHSRRQFLQMLHRDLAQLLQQSRLAKT